DGGSPFHARTGGDVLPGEEEAQEIARRHRLDLRAQALDRVMMDAHEEPALAPFLRERAGGEAAAHGEAFVFERRERGGGGGCGEAERGGERVGRDRAEAFEAAAEDLDEGVVGGDGIKVSSKPPHWVFVP